MVRMTRLLKFVPPNLSEACINGATNANIAKLAACNRVIVGTRIPVWVPLFQGFLPVMVSMSHKFWHIWHERSSEVVSTTREDLSNGLSKTRLMQISDRNVSVRHYITNKPLLCASQPEQGPEDDTRPKVRGEASRNGLSSRLIS